MLKWIDSHCHLTDLHFQDQLLEVLTHFKERGITRFVQGGIGPENWIQQIELNKKYPEIIPCFGLHPYWVSSHSESECENALDLLAKYLSCSVGIGEMGLDFRPKYKIGCENQDSEVRQIDCFEKQIEMAKVSGKPMVLHLVQAFDETVKIFELNEPIGSGMIHGFNGSQKQAEKYLSLGLHLSVGASLLKIDNERLRQALLSVPLDRLLLETDDFYGEPNTLIQIAMVVAKIKIKSIEEVLDICSRNAQRLFSLHNITG